MRARRGIPAYQLLEERERFEVAGWMLAIKDGGADDHEATRAIVVSKVAPLGIELDGKVFLSKPSSP